jgi:hypothetical protein
VLAELIHIRCSGINGVTPLLDMIRCLKLLVRASAARLIERQALHRKDTWDLYKRAPFDDGTGEQDLRYTHFVRVLANYV